MNKKHLITLFLILLFIIVLLILFKILTSNVKNKSTELFTNYQSVESNNNVKTTPELIKYGHFEQKQHIFNSQVGSGHNIITYPNPGNSSYVLQQSTIINNCPNKNVEYKIKLSLNKKNFYRFRSWICLSDDWNGTNYIFTLKIFNQNDHRMVKTEGQIIENIKIYNVNWTLYEYILELKSYDTGEVNWYLGYHPDNTMGYRYFTGISVTNFNPMLNDFEVIDGLQCFLNVSNNLSFNSTSLTWKDMSNQGRDFKFSTLPVMKDQKSINTLNNYITGPYCNQLGITNQQNITIIWYSKFNQLNQNYNLGITKTDSCLYQLFSIYTDCPRYPYLTVSFNDNDNCIYITCKNIKYRGIYIGISNSMSLYTLTINGNRLFLQKDDTLLDSPDIILYDFSSNNNSFNSNNPFVINPNKDLNMNISAFMIYNRLLSNLEINQIRSYLLNQQLLKENNSNKNNQITNYNKNNNKNNNNNYNTVNYNYEESEKYEEVEKYEEIKSYDNNNLYINQPDDQNDYVYPHEVVNDYDDYYTDQNILLTKDECLEEDNNKDKKKKCPNIFSDRSWDVFENFNSETSKQLNKKYKSKKNNNYNIIETFTSVKENSNNEEDSSNDQSQKNLDTIEEDYNDTVEEIKQENANSNKKKMKNIISDEKVSNQLNNYDNIPPITKNLGKSLSSETVEEEFEKVSSSSSPPNNGKQKEDEELNDQDKQEPSFYQVNNDNPNDLDTQTVNNIINSNQYINQTIKSDYRQNLISFINRYNQTNNIQEKEFLLYKIKSLNQLVCKDEEEIKANPNQKKNKLIDAQGNLIDRASFGTSSDENNQIFNRILYTDHKDCPKDIDLSKYIKKSDVDANYISKKTVYQDYVKKDEIPCWGCNLRD